MFQQFQLRLDIPNLYSFIVRTTCHKICVEFVFRKTHACHSLGVSSQLTLKCRGLWTHIQKINTVSCPKCICLVQTAVSYIAAIPVRRGRKNEPRRISRHSRRWTVRKLVKNENCILYTFETLTWRAFQQTQDGCLQRYMCVKFAGFLCICHFNLT